MAHGGIYSGGSHQAFYLLRSLKRAGVDVMAVWGPDEEGDPHGFDRLHELEIPLEIIPINRGVTLDTLRKFRSVLKHFKPDVVECFKNGAQYHALYGGLGLNDHALVFYRGISQRMDVWQGLKYRLRRVDRIIANSQALKRIMIETGDIPIDKMDCVYNEYDPACSDPNLVNADGLKEEMKIPPDVPLITQLGNWSEWRGQTITLEAAKMLVERGSKFHLLFAGRETDKLRPKVDELQIGSKVTLSPYRRDPERVLKITDIAVNASTSHESLSGGLVNAQAMAVPAVASDLAGNPEVVEDGATGFIVPVNDPAALADELAKMIEMPSDKLKDMGCKARDRAQKLFSSDVRVQCTLDVFERAIAQREGRLRL